MVRGGLSFKSIFSQDVNGIGKRKSTHQRPWDQNEPVDFETGQKRVFLAGRQGGKQRKIQEVGACRNSQNQTEEF